MIEKKHVNTCEGCKYVTSGRSIQMDFCPVWGQMVKATDKACIYKNRK